jgi:HK97 family phage major capsid protein
MNDMSDAVKAAKDATQAIYALQQDYTKTNGLAEDTKKNLLDHLHKYEDFAQTVLKQKAAEEKALADLVEKHATAEKSAIEFKTITEEQRKRIDHLEMLLVKGAGSTKDESARETPEYKNFFVFLKGNTKQMQELDVKTLRSDSETQGAYLIPQIMDNVIRKNITEISPVRLFARTRVAPGKTMDIPRRLALPTAYYEGEAETDTAGQSTYGSEQITLYRQSITVPATLDMMVSSAFDLEAEIASDVGEAFGRGEGTAFITGTGQKGPQGFISDTRIEVVDSASSGDIDFGDFATLAGKLKRGQNPMWFFNRRTLAKAWQIKSTIGVPIWSPVGGNSPATIWGFPYSSDMIDLDDAQTGAGAKPVVFADLRRGYEIFDMMGISVIRDDLTQNAGSFIQ